jgi:hypothetical protein
MGRFDAGTSALRRRYILQAKGRGAADRGQRGEAAEAVEEALKLFLRAQMNKLLA